MQPYTPLRSALTLAAGVAFGATAMAADLPKEGTDSFTNTWVLTVLSSFQAGDRSITAYELTGTTRNDAGGALFNFVGQHCHGSVLGSSSGVHLDDLCIYTDKDGDQIFQKVAMDAPSVPIAGGPLTLVGGTGKYTGITGTGEWKQYLATPIKADDKAYRGVVFGKVGWKLP